MAAAMTAAFLAWLCLAALVGVLLWQQRQDLYHDSEVRAAATTALLQAHTANTFQAVDNALVEIAAAVERDRPPRHDPKLRESMRARLPAMPYVRALFVIGPDGRIRHDTDYPSTPDVSLADRPYFRQYADAPSDVDHALSGPLQSRSGTGWFIAATRRIGDGAKFRGVAVAAIELGYFSMLYRKVGLGKDDHVALFHGDGRLLAQHPPAPGEVGKNYAAYPLFREHLARASWGVYQAAGAPFGYRRVVGFAQVPGEPLVVTQVVEMSGRLAGWQNLVLVTAAVLLAVLAALLAGVRQAVRTRAQRQRTRERQQQSEKIEAMGLLASTIAHDFANVLGIVATNLEVLRRTGPRDGIPAAALERAQRALDNGTSMTRQLLSFSRKRELQVAPADLNEAVTGALPLLRQAAGERIRVRTELDAGLPACKVDRGQLETALINLVVNARHAIEGPGEVIVRTRTVTRPAPGPAWPRRRGPDFACVTVQDNGRGMSDEVRRHAAEPFFTTKGEEGTGLGLAQVYGFVQQLGGDVTIDSQPGAGTAVHLCFPAQ
jgi:signal transduction histidine kinase